MSWLGELCLQILDSSQNLEYATPIPDYPPANRQALWRLLGSPEGRSLSLLWERFRVRRIQIDEVMGMLVPPLDDLSIACLDLFEFSRQVL